MKQKPLMLHLMNQHGVIGHELIIVLLDLVLGLFAGVLLYGFYGLVEFGGQPAELCEEQVEPF